MTTLQHLRLLTAEEFVRVDFHPDLEAELGVIHMMAGGTREHAPFEADLMIADL